MYRRLFFVVILILVISCSQIDQNPIEKAVKDRDSSQCDKLLNDTMLEDCYAAVAKVTMDESLCAKTGAFKQTCYKDIAVFRHDYSICDMGDEEILGCYNALFSRESDNDICRKMSHYRLECLNSTPAMTKEDAVAAAKKHYKKSTIQYLIDVEDATPSQLEESDIWLDKAYLVESYFDEGVWYIHLNTYIGNSSGWHYYGKLMNDDWYEILDGPYDYEQFLKN